jgi:hypothetical protein
MNVSPKMAILACLTLTLFPAAASGVEDAEACRFTDLATQKVFDCGEGPSEESLGYLQYVRESGYELLEGARAKFDHVFVHRAGEGSAVSEDPAYDESDDDAQARADAWEGLLSFLKLFVLLVQGADAYIDALGLTGQYDGRVCHGEDGSGPCVDAFLTLQHNGGAVDGRILVTESGLELDGGACGGVEVPVISLPVHATSSSLTQAQGGTTRQVDYTFFWTGDATVDFDLTLGSDRETLVVDIDLTLEDPCADSALRGTFTRRMDALFDL